MDYSKKFIKLNLIMEVTGVYPQDLVDELNTFIQRVNTLTGASGELNIPNLSMVAYPDHTEAQG